MAMTPPRVVLLIDSSDITSGGCFMEQAHGGSNAALGRLTGATALGMVVVFATSILLGPGSMFHSDPAAQRAIAYVAQNGRLIWVQGFLDGMVNTVFALLVVLLVALTGGRGILSRISYISVAAAAALQWAHAGMLYALADLAHRGGSDAGVLALFSLGKTMDDADAVPIAIAFACVGVLMLWSRALPAGLAWLTLVVCAVSVISTVSAIAGGGSGAWSSASRWSSSPSGAAPPPAPRCGQPPEQLSARASGSPAAHA